jgi:glycine hydroxymethyltransferase
LLNSSLEKQNHLKKKVINNAKVLCDALKMEGFKIVSNGTDNHIVLVDVKSSVNLTGKEAEEILDEIGITCNKNMIPYDVRKALDPS